MNRYHLLSLAFFVLGIVFFALGIQSGEIKSGFIVVFPFLMGSGLYSFFGFICMVSAILMSMFGFMNKSRSSDLQVDEKDAYTTQKKKSVKGGGVVLIGPIPIVFGSNWKIAIAMMVLAIIIIIIAYFFFRYS